MDCGLLFNTLPSVGGISVSSHVILGIYLEIILSVGQVCILFLTKYSRKISKQTNKFSSSVIWQTKALNLMF